MNIYNKQKTVSVIESQIVQAHIDRNRAIDRLENSIVSTAIANMIRAYIEATFTRRVS